MDSTIQLRSGRRLDLLNPGPEDILLTDIAHALSNLCRFTGHSERFYSVAQHSCLVSGLVGEEHALAALMHDSAEAYLGDLSTPLKGIMDSPRFVALEDHLCALIAKKFDYEYPFHSSVKAADQLAFEIERKSLLPELRTHPANQLQANGQWTARQAFLKRFEEVSNANRSLRVLR